MSSTGLAVALPYRMGQLNMVTPTFGRLLPPGSCAAQVTTAWSAELGAFLHQVNCAVSRTSLAAGEATDAEAMTRTRLRMYARQFC